MEHAKQWDFLKGKFEAGQLGHAYLFSGQDIDGLKNIAKELVKLINLPAQAGGKSIAGSPLAIEKEQFPDLFIVKSQNSKSSLKDGEDKQEIDIALIREAQNFLSYKSYYGNYKSVIIENAERMNAEAQDCFLKSLEEPKGDTLIILTSSMPDMMSATIFSRCQQLKFFNSGKSEFSSQQSIMLQNLLRVVNGDLAEKFLYAKSVGLDANNVSNILEVFKKYFRHLLLLKIGAVPPERSKDFTISPVVLDKYSVLKIKNILTLAQKLSYQVFATNANPKLALEILLMEV